MVNKMHSLCHLLAYKTQQVFFARVIHTIIDQNWDLKGFKQVFMRMLGLLELNVSGGNHALEKHLDKLLNTQNLQSTSCIRAIGAFLRNAKKEIDEDDLSNPIKTYQTDFEFLKADIEHFRGQKMNHQCFQVLHPWAYELDNVDFKYILNNDLAADICVALPDLHAQVFWLSFFKPQRACAADEFFEAVRQVCEMNKMRSYWEGKEREFQEHMRESDYVISIDSHADTITRVINDLVVEALNRCGYCVLEHQLKFYQAEFEGTAHCDAQALGAYSYDTNPHMEYFKNDPVLGKLALKDLPGKELSTPSAMQRSQYNLAPEQLPQKKLVMKFESVDTEELKGVEIAFDGQHQVFKVGEGEANHYQIPNDKKLWESQFMIVVKDGQYYIRDLGFVHTSRVKLDKRAEVRIQKGSIVDLGKVVHYHFDKAIHSQPPSEVPSETYYVTRPSDSDCQVDTDDYPHLRARPTWVSADENVDNIQNEINIYADNQKMVNTLGRSMKRDIQIKLKAVSADHCAIAYSKERGWTITEKGKERVSSNGTFIFMKSMKQMNDHVPSDLIPLHDEMVISFVNYELKVSLLQKSSEELKHQAAELASQNANPNPLPSAQPPKQEPQPSPGYSAEVHPAEPLPAEASGEQQPASSEQKQEELPPATE
jgi:predicted component of type VI protein secretion system